MLSKITASLIFDKSVALMLTRLWQFAIIAVVFIPLERLIPFRPRQRLFRPLIALDLLHYFVGGVLTIVFVRITYMFLPRLSAWGVHQLSFINVGHLPWWGQLLAWEAGWTFLGYWLHRLEHVWYPLWRMHAIHESSTELDWLSAFRLHPLDPAMFQVLTIVPLWMLGMQYPVAMGYTIFSYVLTHVQHANVVFPIGPLKYILPTPEFHRWHHARIIDEMGNERPALHNFGQYPIWDVLFGTFYVPDQKPAALGSSFGDQIPTEYLAQLVYPFGLHETVLAWRRSFLEHLNLRERLAKIRTAVSPVHEKFENQIARLCLLREPQVMPMTPTFQGEKQS